MNLQKEITGFNLTKDKIKAGLNMLELTPQDLDQLYQSENRFTQLLKNYSSFPDETNNSRLDFFYDSPDTHDLETLRSQHNLNQIAGNGNDFYQALNLMHWTHQLTMHTSNAIVPENMNALTLIDLIQREGKHINCAMFATILRDACLAVGLKARVIHLKPYSFTFLESHLINAVYSSHTSKWIYLDPNLNAYFMDQDGQALAVSEIRQRLADGSPLYINDELAFNSDNVLFRTLGTHFGSDFYKLYIAKNIFRFECRQQNTFDAGSKTRLLTYYELIPANYYPKLLSNPQTKGNKTTIYTNDANQFWVKPERDM